MKRKDKDNKDTDRIQDQRTTNDDLSGYSNQTGDLDRVENMDTDLDSGLDELDRAKDYEKTDKIQDPGSSNLEGEVERGPESGRGGRVKGTDTGESGSR